LLKLGHRVSSTIIRNLLRRHRIPPAARRAGLTWRRFLQAHAGGSANSATGNGWLSTRKPDDSEDELQAAAVDWQDDASFDGRRQAATGAFTYDPADPVPSIGGRFQASVPGGPYDQSQVERRPDVLVYSTAPLKHSLEVTGPISVTLYAASSARDTDFTAKLVDVYPDR
jgi:uncharacterized protein